MVQGPEEDRPPIFRTCRRKCIHLGDRHEPGCVVIEGFNKWLYAQYADMRQSPSIFKGTRDSGISRHSCVLLSLGMMQLRVVIAEGQDEVTSLGAAFPSLIEFSAITGVELIQCTHHLFPHCIHVLGVAMSTKWCFITKCPPDPEYDHVGPKEGLIPDGLPPFVQPPKCPRQSAFAVDRTSPRKLSCSLPT
jgi:hypothetical protein